MDTMVSSIPATTWVNLKEDNLREHKGVHIIKVLVSDDIHYKHLYPEVLSADEQRKAQRFRFENDQRSYRLRKFVLRKLLADVTGIKTSELIYHYEKHKKPVIEGIAFNSSHSGNCILIALSPVAIGIDIEQIRQDFDFSIMMDTCFTPAERLFIAGEPNHFFSLWTRKEALLKADGSGLISNLNELDCMDNEIFFKEQRYMVRSGKIDENYTMSLAVNTGEIQINYWNY